MAKIGVYRLEKKLQIHMTILMENLEQESTVEQRLEQEKLPGLTIGKHTVETCIIQGGMGIGIGMAELVGAVAYEGGIGTLTAGAIHMTTPYKEYRSGLLEEARKQSPNGEISAKERRRLFREANVFCIKEEIRKAKEIAQGRGKIFINIMVASTDYDECVIAACEAGVDGIVSGAGLPTNLHKLTSEYPDVALVPILSYAKGVNVLLNKRNMPYERTSEIREDKTTTINGQKIRNVDGKLYDQEGTQLTVTDKTPSTIIVGDREYMYLKNEEDNSIKLTKQYQGRNPDAITIESVEKGGGHLGVIKGSLDEIHNPESTLEVAIPKVREILLQKGLDIPVIAAGGIVTRKDIDRMFSIGAKGVQMATLPLISKPSRAHEDFKYAVIHAGKDDIHEFNSSAIYPARRLRKSLIGADMVGEDLEKIRSEKRTCLRHCLHHCAYRDRIPGYAQICIMDALVRSTRGSDGSGLRFIGYPLDENGKNKITSELGITSPITIKEIFEILQRKTT